MHQQERNHDRQVRDRVDEHETADAEGDDQHSADERTDQGRSVERGRVQADGAHELFVRDEARHHRLPRGRIEREDDRVQGADEDDLDDVDLIRDRKDREDGRGDRRARLREQEQTTAIGAIGDDAAEEAEGKTGKRARKADEAEIEGGELRDTVLDRELDDEPSETELLHPRPDVRDDEADPEQPEIAVLERRPRGGAARLGGGSFVESFGLEFGGELFCGHVQRECMGVEPTTERSTPRQRF